MRKRLWTLAEAAEQLSIPLSWLYERSRRDALPGLVRLGKYIRLTEQGLQALAGGAPPEEELSNDVVSAAEK